MKILLLPFALFFFHPVLVHSVAGANSASAQEDSTSPSLLTKAEASKLGFSIKASAQIPPTEWEVEKFGLLSKWQTRLKSTFPSHLGRTSFYRFIIEEENYPDSALAKFRLDSLRVLPPNLSPDDWKAFPLRRGIQSGNRVIVVRTDVMAYKRKLEEMKSALEVLTSNSDTRNRTRLLDSLGKALRVVRR